MDLEALLVAVDEAFARTARGLDRWDDPHPPPDRIVADEEYSRVTNPARWRIIGARADAWLEVLAAHGLAAVRRGVAVEWVEPPGPIVTRTDLVRPTVEHGLPLVVGRSRIGDVDDAGVTLGVGLPAVLVHAIPDCGCDACDSGSADVVEEADTWLGGIVQGELRHLVRPHGTITLIADRIRQASHQPQLPTAADGWRWLPAPAGDDESLRDADRGHRPDRPFDVDTVLADPSGWREWSGPSWLA